MLETSYMYNNQYTKEFMDFTSKDYRRNEQLNIVCVEDGLVLPLKLSETGIPLLGIGGVLDSNDEYVMASAQIGKGDTADRFIGKYDYDKSLEEYNDDEVIYIGALPRHWGHFLVDMTYRFWIFADERFAEHKVVYCAHEGVFSGVQLEFMQMLGIHENRLIKVSVPTRYKKIYIPEQGYMACDYYTQEYRNIFIKLRKNLPELKSISCEKIYLSRRHLEKAKRSEIGEKDIEKNFARNGFHVLYMEELGLAEQIFYISKCKIVVALSGTLCHNILFADKETTLIILNKTHMLNTHQVLINQMIQCKVIYIDVYIEPFRHFPISYGDGPFLLSSEKLQSYFQNNDMKFRGESLIKKGINFCFYVYVCASMKINMFLHEFYAKSYRKACEHKWIINSIRFLKTKISCIVEKR